VELFQKDYAKGLPYFIQKKIIEGKKQPKGFYKYLKTAKRINDSCILITTYIILQINKGLIIYLKEYLVMIFMFFN
jgi:hypothetical protein